MISGIQHVALEVRDLEEAKRFYKIVFDAEVLKRPRFPDAPPGAWLQVGSHQIHLIVSESVAGTSSGHVAFETPDLEAALLAIEASGISTMFGTSIDRAAHVAGAGRQAFFRDPSGNLLELNERD